MTHCHVITYHTIPSHVITSHHITNHFWSSSKKTKSVSADGRTYVCTYSTVQVNAFYFISFHYILVPLTTMITSTFKITFLQAHYSPSYFSYLYFVFVFLFLLFIHLYFFSSVSSCPASSASIFFFSSFDTNSSTELIPILRNASSTPPPCNRGALLA